VATGRQTENQLDAFAVDTNGVLNVFWAVGSQPWNTQQGQPPVFIGQPGYFPAGAAVAAEKQGNPLVVNQLDAFAVDTIGALNVSWVVNTGLWNGPDRIS
jgi:hypothetical protein